MAEDKSPSREDLDRIEKEVTDAANSLDESFYQIDDSQDSLSSIDAPLNAPSEPSFSSDKLPDLEINPPEESDAPQLSDPLVEHVDLSDAQWAGGEIDQAPDDIRSGNDIVHTAYQYHQSMADVLRSMTDVLLNCVHEIEEIKARFQRMQ